MTWLVRRFRRPHQSPAATADLDALAKAEKILDDAQFAVYRKHGGSPEWAFLAHAKTYISEQRAQAFRYALGRPE